MIEATVYILKNNHIEDRTSTFDCKAKDFENHLTYIYGKDNMDNVEWDIWEPPEEEGLEEVELESEVGKYLKKKMKRKKDLNQNN